MLLFIFLILCKVYYKFFHFKKLLKKILSIVIYFIKFFNKNSINFNYIQLLII